jgi:hypothetical protein
MREERQGPKKDHPNLLEIIPMELLHNLWRHPGKNSKTPMVVIWLHVLF